MPALCAASRSATAVLAQIRYRHPNSPINLHRPTQIGNSKAAAAPLATSSTSPLNPTASDHFPYPPRSNPHSARRPAKRTHSRGFLPWSFSYAGPGTRSTVRSGRHPKTFTKADISAHRELVQKDSTPRAPFELRDQIAASTFAALRIDSGV